MKPFNPTVGLILNFRDALRTTRCVESLLCQGIKSVLVWDNSDDKGVSAKELRAYLTDYPEVHIEISYANLGFSAGVNSGLAWIATRFSDAWVILINNDAYLLPNALTLLTDALVRNPMARIAYPNVKHNRYTIGTRYYHRLTGLLTAWPLYGSFPYPSGCCLLIAVDRVSLPLFDEDFFMYGEDTALGNKLGQECFVHVSETLVVHEGSASSGQESLFYESRIVAAHLQLAQKMARNKLDLILMLLGRTGMLIFRCLLRVIRFRSKTPLFALREGWNIANGNDPLIKHASSVNSTSISSSEEL